VGPVEHLLCPVDAAAGHGVQIATAGSTVPEGASARFELSDSVGTIGVVHRFKVESRMVKVDGRGRRSSVRLADLLQRKVPAAARATDAVPRGRLSDSRFEPGSAQHRMPNAESFLLAG